MSEKSYRYRVIFENGGHTIIGSPSPPKEFATMLGELCRSDGWMYGDDGGFRARHVQEFVMEPSVGGDGAD